MAMEQHHLAEAQNKIAEPVSFTREERKRIQQYKHPGYIDPKVYAVKQASMWAMNRQWYNDYNARLRSLERAEGL